MKPVRLTEVLNVMVHKGRSSLFIPSLYNWMHEGSVLFHEEHWAWINFREKNTEFNFENDNFEMHLWLLRAYFE